MEMAGRSPTPSPRGAAVTRAKDLVTRVTDLVTRVERAGQGDTFHLSLANESDEDRRSLSLSTSVSVCMRAPIWCARAL